MNCVECGKPMARSAKMQAFVRKTDGFYAFLYTCDTPRCSKNGKTFTDTDHVIAMTPEQYESAMRDILPRS